MFGERRNEVSKSHVRKLSFITEDITLEIIYSFNRHTFTNIRWLKKILKRLKFLELGKIRLF